jgi:hypothetical protein
MSRDAYLQLLGSVAPGDATIGGRGMEFRAADEIAGEERGFREGRGEFRESREGGWEPSWLLIGWERPFGDWGGGAARDCRGEPRSSMLFWECLLERC